MGSPAGSAEELIEIIRSRAPGLLDLLTASSKKEFDDAFTPLIEQAVTDLEQNKTNYSEVHENGLTAHIAASLRIPGLTVTLETNSNGHVDITIKRDHSCPSLVKLGEAKIYKGYAYHVGGLTQLLSRYSTGRESRGLLIIYFKRSGIAELVTKLREDMDEHRPCQQVQDTTADIRQWSFNSRHRHSSGEDVEVNHVGCNLFIDQVK